MLVHQRVSWCYPQWIVVQCCTCFRKTLRKNTTMSGIGGWEESWVGFCWCFIASQDATTVSDSIRSVLFRIDVTCICIRYKIHFWYMGVLESSMINMINDSPGNPFSAGSSTGHSPLLIWMTVRFQGDPRGHSSDEYVRQIMQQHQCRMTPLATWQCLCENLQSQGSKPTYIDVAHAELAFFSTSFCYIMDLPGSFVQPFSTCFIFHSNWQMSYIYIYIYHYIYHIYRFPIIWPFDTYFDTEIAGQPQAIPWPHAWPSWAPSSAWRCRSCWRWRRRPCHKNHSWNMLKAWNHHKPPTQSQPHFPSCPSCPFCPCGPSEVPSRTAKLPETPAKGKRSRNSATSGAGHFCRVSLGPLGALGGGWTPQGSKSSLRPLAGLDSLEPPLDSAVMRSARVDSIAIIICPYLSDLIKYQIFGVSDRSLFILIYHRPFWKHHATSP